ncbi:hypothetical protein FKW77_007295 [Venturia effusa]|uniref:BTB domain-containing protein n=1 Tax=Venturia effusa TaxID=50376 RepID=A0A517L1J9_9PEZI|nr:hypothetical protein FKW77_007295 [Venturia effusa]
MATDLAVNDPAATLKGGIARLLDSDEFSDLTLICKGKQFKAHKAVICQQSRFFYNACKKNTFKVGQRARGSAGINLFQESENGVIDLSHDDPDAVEAMYRYFYTCDYSELAKDSPNAMLLHARVYCLAHKYEIESLKLTAVELFEDTAKVETISAETLTPIVKEIYDNTDDHDKLLRPAAVNIAIENRFAIFKNGGGEFAIMMREAGEFGKDVFQAMSTEYLITYKCPNQGYQFRIDDRAGLGTYRHNPVCPSCHVQHLIKEDPEIEAKLKFVDQTCSNCSKLLECVQHNSKGYIYSFWCAWCNGVKPFRLT